MSNENEEEMIPNDGRRIDINSPTAKNIIEGVIPKAIRTWTIFKNTNNILEGIEAITFAIRQVALDEIEKESDNVVFMSDATVKTIIGTLKRLEQENAKLEGKYQEELTVNTQLQEWQDEDLRQIAGLKRELEQANEWNKTLWQKLEKIKEYITDYPNVCKIKGNCIDSRMCSTCFLGGGLEVCDYIVDIIEGAEDDKTM